MNGNLCQVGLLQNGASRILRYVVKRRDILWLTMIKINQS